MTPNKDIKPKVSEWEKEFEKEFEKGIESTSMPGFMEDIKSFIQSLLDQQRQEIIAELEGMYYKPEAPEELKIDSHQVFFNQALELAISKIKEL